MGLNIGKPTRACSECGASLVRYVDMDALDSYQACPDCEEEL